MALLASTGTTIAFTFGMALVSFFLIRHSRRYYARQKAQTAKSPPLAQSSLSDNSVSHVSTLPAEIGRWHVQLHDTMRDLMGEMDSKQRALQVLIYMANEATMKLEAAIQQAQQLDGTADELAEANPGKIDRS